MADELIKRCIERYELAEEADKDNRQRAADDMRFAIGKQWPDDIETQRRNEQRPCLTINRVQQMVKQVVNDMRQNRPAIKVHPVDSGADVAVAEVLSGMIRHIEVDSNAADAYDHAGECAVKGGEGYFRIVTEFEYPESFDQCIKIRRVRNPFSVYIDPFAKEADGSDAQWCHVIDDMPKDDFKREFPEAKMVDYETSTDSPDWINDETVRVCEYFEVEKKSDTLYLLKDGTSALLSDMPGTPPKEIILKSRQAETRQVKWYKVTAVEILEEKPWPGIYIPIIRIPGEEHDIEGEVHRFSLVYHAKDPQRIYNYSRTAAVEQVALAPKAPFIIAEGQVEGYEDEWGSANTKSYAYLPYKPTTIGGVAVPPPMRQGYAGTPVGAMTDLQLAADEIKATTGIYDASLGNRSNETSGVAIQRRDAQADTATFHFTDNLARGIRYCGRQLVDMIPKIYDTPRQVRILGVDGAESIAAVNMPDPFTGKKINPLDVGRYDVTVDVGPSFQTRRQEAAESMTAFVQAFPPAAQVAGDLIAKAMDWPDADEIAKRLRAAMPPGIVDDEESEVPPQVQAKMQEQMQVIQGLQQAMQEAQQQLQQAQQVAEGKRGEEAIKAAELQMKQQSEQVTNALGMRKLEIDAFNAETNRLKAESDIALKMQEQANSEAEKVESMKAVQEAQAAVFDLEGKLNQMQQALGEIIAATQTVAVKPIRGPDGRLVGATQVKANGDEVQVSIGGE